MPKPQSPRRAGRDRLYPSLQAPCSLREPSCPWPVNLGLFGQVALGGDSRDRLVGLRGVGARPAVAHLLQLAMHVLHNQVDGHCVPAPWV